MNKIKHIFLLLLIPTILVFGWGDKGHKLIAKHALELLPANIGFSNEIRLAIIEHSVDPDYRKKSDKTEPNKHYIDIDYYKEFLNGHMITSKNALIKEYGEDVVAKQGVLPWATEDSYAKLVEALKKKDKAKIILYGSDLAHYVGDGHQPLHTCMNYNGQLTGRNHNVRRLYFRYRK